MHTVSMIGGTRKIRSGCSSDYMSGIGRKKQSAQVTVRKEEGLRTPRPLGGPVAEDWSLEASGRRLQFY
jgi:hypothetical protein